jgi:sterol desaturase/sphingolipid hydroxylase (fatty acid hydroxylase superfamily)
MFISIVLTCLITLVVSSFFGHWVHWSLHQHWTRKLNQKHMTHHEKLYPANDYLSLTYRDSGKDNTVFIFFVLSLPVILTPIVLGILGIISLPIVITAFLTMAAFSFASNYFHDAFHIRNHWINNFSMFRSWNTLHYEHHIDQNKNFGIVFFGWDRLFGVYKPPIK